MKIKTLVQNYAGSLLIPFVVFGCASLATHDMGERKPAALDPLQSKIDQVLGFEERSQQVLTALNVRYESYFRNFDDVRRVLDTQLVFPNTEADKSKKYVLSTEYAKDLSAKSEQAAVSASLPVSLFQSGDWKSDARIQGLQVLGSQAETSHRLMNGALVLAPKPIPQDDPLAALAATKEVCFYEDGPAQDPISYFLKMHANNLSCAFASSADLVVEPAQGLIQKVKWLTGSEIPVSAVKNPDPNYPFDFSRAPFFDTILVSYLEFKNDVTGQWISRILKYHASRGTQVRIILSVLPIQSQSYVQPNDRKLMNDLLASSPNVRIQDYTFSEANPDLATPFSRQHRVLHTKLLVALSSKTPEASGIMLGGRNLKDVFYMEHAPNYSKWPELIQYQEMPTYPFYRDLEVFVQSHALATQVASQFTAFWYRDRSGPKLARATQHLPIAEGKISQAEKDLFRQKLKSQSYVRHFFSTPYAERKELEKMFIEMLDLAKNSIRITTPYFRPTSQMAKALTRAALRGVRIDIISSLLLEGDDVPDWTDSANMMSYNSIIKQNEKFMLKQTSEITPHINLYNWKESFHAILHVKSFLIDDQLLYVGSANLNERTFVHDIEDGAIFVGPVADQYRELYDNYYRKNSVVVDQRSKIKFLNHVIVKVLDKLNAN